jgi:hypothetical protein
VRRAVVWLRAFASLRAASVCVHSPRRVVFVLVCRRRRAVSVHGLCDVDVPIGLNTRARQTVLRAVKYLKYSKDAANIITNISIETARQYDSMSRMVCVVCACFRL